MKFKMPLFLWVSSLLAGAVFLLLAFAGWPYILYFGQSEFEGLSLEEQKMLTSGFVMGLRVLGVAILLSGTLLFLFRKKLSRKVYAGIFAFLMMLCLLVASLTAKHFGT
ncbi:MAG TPA: hypothetical protein DCG19_11735 [Cryomorphaceae bacterium]|nr:hypothetical protein [Owenweeksia sp.]MBF99076.1 hypothetical protein [Owenweeksia sp.]HAD98070.1 hypothetical protein [Cryomorphaceae bacterium]HBF21597.1 hypothetical protein [Cryomorphaceae bacterium]|tara:strand:+ start:4355 stop:4681 length:327 start_codon:yes stop_codon:yes gene_type:complete